MALSLLNKIKALSPSAYWPMQEASGTVIEDVMSSPANGVYSNGPALVSAGAGFAGVGSLRAMKESGNKYGIAAASDKFDVTPAFTLLCFARLNSGIAYRMIVGTSFGNHDDPYYPYGIMTGDNGRISERLSVQTSGSFSPSDWAKSGDSSLGLFAISVDLARVGGEIILYHNDGVADATITRAGTAVVAANTFGFGVIPALGDGFSIDVDLAHVALWNSVALTQADIQSIWAARDSLGDPAGGGGAGTTGYGYGL